MPGIVGFIAKERRHDVGNGLARMLGTMLHERFYRSGIIVQKTLGLAAGWTCHEGSFSDCLPIWNVKRNICLLFVGEHYPDQHELDRLRSCTHQFDPNNARYLVHLYEEFGDGMFKRLNGTFCGLLIDCRRNEVVLFNDRYGLGRVYVYESPGGLYFASEAKAILEVVPHLRQFDLRSLGEFFACGCVLENRTLFREISLLPAGSAWTFKVGEASRKRLYFEKREWEEQGELSETEYYDRLKSTWQRVLPRYFRTCGKLAVSLTGGLDSRIIMAWARPAPAQLPCYSHRGAFRECADARIARRVAGVCGQPHRVVEVNGEFLADFPALAERTVYVTDGTMDVSGAAGLYANQVARREISPLRMTGNYGGEILRGLIALSPAKLQNPFFEQELARAVQEGVETLLKLREGNRLSFIAFRQMPWHHYARFAMESSQLTVRSPYLDNDLVSLAYRSPSGLAANQRLAVRLIADGNPKLAAFPTDRGPLGRVGPLGRLTEQYQDFTFRVEHAYDYGMPGWLCKADRVLSRFHLERLFLGRHKYSHFRYWYRNGLAKFVEEILLDPQTLGRPYFDRRAVERLVVSHTAGRANCTLEIHKLLTYEMIQRRLIRKV